MLRKWQPLTKTIAHWLAYVIWVVIFRLIILTLITYFMGSSGTSTGATFQEISDVYSSYELFTLALGAALYLLLLRHLNPLAPTSFSEIFTPHRFERRFIPGFLRGAVLALAVTLIFLLGGYYRYMGLLLHLEEAPFALLSITLKTASLGVLIYCEEFIFRNQIFNLLKQKFRLFPTVFFSSLLYCVTKTVQFDLGVMQLVTLLLLSWVVAMRTTLDEDFVRGAGLIIGLLTVFHPLLGLPIFGLESQGVLLLKYHKYQSNAESTEAIRLLTGGVGGPLSSITLQLFLLFDFIQIFYKNKKTLLNAAQEKIE